MEAARLAAKTLIEGFAKGDLSEERLRIYQRRIDRAFGWQLWLYVVASSRRRMNAAAHAHSRACAGCRSIQTTLFLERHPFLFDGAARVIQRNGDFVHAWCSVRSGQKSKLWFMRPDVAVMILLDALLRYFASRIGFW